MFDKPHRRYNPLKDEWILVSPQRLSRPWQGDEGELEEQPPSYDPECYLCPGNGRITGEQNPAYDGVFVFKNDFAALMEDVPVQQADDPLFRAETTSGECHVICFSPDHGKSLPQLSRDQIVAVVDTWCELSDRLGQTYTSVQIFENKGAMMGCSNPHPHGQVWAASHVPDELRRENASMRGHFANFGTPMLLDLAQREAELGERVVVQTDHWLAIVPYWAEWPFETLLLPRFPVQRMPDLNVEQRDDLALALQELTVRYDNLFQCSFPYSMGWHGAPFGEDDAAHWQLHAHFYPPLLRSATIRKFMVGYEMLAEAQRDLTPEKAADMLRSVSDTRFSEQAR
ncbi:UDP-glucose--hexose-1-phosphate uridylyltransferase [Parasphingorhabdus sp.]|uniref:UDP-glucose--hexose-1-phosphate uridylyltransferase n=1 Tax=Parasphingorhabdus sp. TaxID=2709688 RepID=UPI003BB0DA5A